MKYIVMVMLVLLVLAIFSVGMFTLFNAEVKFIEDSPKTEISFVDKLDFHACNNNLNTLINQLKSQPHKCRVDEDCQLKEHRGGCGNFIINNGNAVKVDDLFEEKKRTCIIASQAVCMMAYDPYKYEAQCIDNYCKKAKIIDPPTELRKFLNSNPIMTSCDLGSDGITVVDTKSSWQDMALKKAQQP